MSESTECPDQVGGLRKPSMWAEDTMGVATKKLLVSVRVSKYIVPAMAIVHSRRTICLWYLVITAYM